MTKVQSWQPLADENLKEIRERFVAIFPVEEFGDLAERIGAYWIAMLGEVWKGKDQAV